MARRPRMTAADYLTIAISPALIMLLIGSLVFFLVAVFYQGGYSARVSYVLALFIFATVLIGRISIEDGSERAVLFAFPLGLATFCVLNVFVRHALGFTWIINGVILAIIWFLAHKLTWDCTVIDDREDASGEGLLQSAGFASSSRSEGGTSSEKEDSGGDKGSQSDTKNPLAEEDKTWWQRYQQRRSRKHAPGVWVLYLSIVALPLFGFLQRAIPFTDSAARSYSFTLLVVFVASALGLLLATAFLALRRYLRQRRLEMPTSMAMTWVLTGAALILGVLIFSATLPRPAAETPLAQMPFQITSHVNLEASRAAPLSSDGTENDENPNAARTEGESDTPGGQIAEHAEQTDSSQSGGQRSGGQQSDKQGKSDSGQSKGRESNDSESKESESSGESNSGDANPESRSDERQSPSNTKKNRQAGEKTSQRQNEGSDSEPSGERSQNGDPDEAQNRERNAETTSQEEQDSTQNSETDSSERSNDHRQSSRTYSISPPPGSSWLGAIAKLLFYAALIAVAAYMLWKNREKIRPALAKLWAELRELWERLWGRKPREKSHNIEDTVAAPRPRPFSDFVDPFANGSANSLAPDALVSYSYAAFCAWARERGIECREDQTARELASLVVRNDPNLSTEATHLANLYGQAAYAPGSITCEQTMPLENLWNKMRAAPQVAQEELVVR